MSKIAVRLEGGVGDCILGCRFIDAIQEQYVVDNMGKLVFEPPEIIAYLDTEGNPLQKEVIDYIYPNLFNETITIPRKKYSKMMIRSQYGDEEMKGFIENVPDEYMKQINSCDQFYDLHIDSLKFMDYNFNWIRNFTKILPPSINPNVFLGNYICSQLVSSSSNVHRMEQWYIDLLVSGLDDLADQLGWKHVIISTPETNKFYDSALAKTRVTHIVNSHAKDVCDFVHRASAFIGVDSAWRLIGYANDIPTITLSKDCVGWGGVPPSHQLRWLLWPDTTFQIHYDSNQILKVFENMIRNPLYRLIPKLQSNGHIIKRDYKIIEDQSILNDEQ